MKYEKLDRKPRKNKRRLSCKINCGTSSQSTICLPIDGEEYELVNYFDGICIKQMCNLDKHWIDDVRERDRHTEREREDRLLSRIKFAFRFGDSCLWDSGSVTAAAAAAAAQFSELAVCWLN